MVESLETDSNELKRYHEEQAARGAARIKTAKDLSEKLVEAGVAVVSADYDGCGDSGQIENLVFYAPAEAGGSEVDVPDELCNEVEELLYDLLAERHGGWDIGEGAYGSFSWSPATQSMAHEHNDRFTDIDTSTHVGFGVGHEQPASATVDGDSLP